MIAMMLSSAVSPTLDQEAGRGCDPRPDQNIIRGIPSIRGRAGRAGGGIK